MKIKKTNIITNRDKSQAIYLHRQLDGYMLIKTDKTPTGEWQPTFEPIETRLRRTRWDAVNRAKEILANN